jgi:hypothetical protein
MQVVAPIGTKANAQKLIALDDNDVPPRREEIANMEVLPTDLGKAQLIGACVRPRLLAPHVQHLPPQARAVTIGTCSA